MEASFRLKSVFFIFTFAFNSIQRRNRNLFPAEKVTNSVMISGIFRAAEAFILPNI